MWLEVSVPSATTATRAPLTPSGAPPFPMPDLGRECNAGVWLGLTLTVRGQRDAEIQLDDFFEEPYH